MASFHSGRSQLTAHAAGNAVSASGAPDELLGPVIAGAYARGIAETFDLLGLPGLFLDADGEILFASRAATALLRGPLRLHARHLVADAGMDNACLGSFIADAVGAATGPAALRLPGAGLQLRRLPATAGAALPGQSMRAIIVIADEADPRHAAALRLIG